GHSPGAAARLLREAVSAGQLCEHAVHAVLASGEEGLAPSSAPGASLSAREAEILRRVARGASNKQVAAELGISAATVKRHLENVFDKVGVRTGAAVTVWAIERGYINTPS